MENDTVHYLTSIINLLQKKPEVQKIIDTHGLGQELTFGQIGFKNSGAFLRVYEILNSIDGAETTPIREAKFDQTKQYSFRLVAPVNLSFFHCTGVFDEQDRS
jgi:hypothetical protein|nr:MAG TPA: hypothetical protein [Caudoviricetes sp.]